MKRFPILMLALLGLSLMTFTGCDKDDDDNNPTQPTATNPTPTRADADAIMAAIQVVSYQDIPIIGGQQAIFADVAVASLFDAPGNSTFLDWGTVTCNSKNLAKQSNNSYIFPEPGTTDISLSLAEGDPVEWTASGAPAVSYTTSSGMPNEVKFDGDYSTGTAGSALTVQIETAPNSDRILWVLAVGETTITEETSGGLSQFTFTAAQTTGLSGTGVLQVVPFNIENALINGSNIYFVNERVLNQFIEF